ncbi:hypothetical protein HPB51_020457 [Rhipicephalus microplus]|uniref:Transmembrane protein n=1 Tax=Rhipicephalus microplus TaxID=6941 RepID=A0A9J6DCT5_RHIMP|nr:hypothetical protein HPB51_020457 [Rhipicephalus microplus]
MARHSRIDEVRRRLFFDDTSLLGRPRNVRRATSTCVTGLPTSHYEDETPRRTASKSQQADKNQNMLSNDVPEENARLRWSRSQGKACIKHPNASFNGTGPTDKQSDDLTSRENVAGKKSKRADAAKHGDHKSRKQHNQTSKCLVQSDSSGSVGLAGKQMGSGSVLCRKLKLPFSRVAVRALEGTGSTSKEKEVGSQDVLPNFFDSGTLGLTGSSVDPVKETPTNCRSPAFQVFPESNARSTWSAASWNTNVDVEAVHQTPLSSTPFDSSESTYLGLPSPLAVLSAFVGGHVMERHIRHAWTWISNSSASASGSPSTPSGHQDLDVVRSLGKTSRPLSSRDSVSPELRRNYVRSLSFDHVSFPETSKLTPLEHSFPTGWTREGKPLLLKATGQKASGIASQSTDTQQAQVSSYPVGQSCSGFESRRPGATLLSESPAVEKQQPVMRIFFRRKATIYAGVLLVALALWASQSAKFLPRKVITAKNFVFFTPRISGSLQVAKNGSFVAPDTIENVDSRVRYEGNRASVAQEPEQRHGS